VAPSEARVSLFRPGVSAAAVEAAATVLASGWIGQGPKVEALEEAIAKRLGVAHCVVVSTGTAALHLALSVLDLPPGGEVVTTPMTWVSTHHAIDYVGCHPVLADIEPHTGNIDPRRVEDRIGDRTVALLVVHYGGYPCDLDAIRAIADRHGLPLVEDAAHAFGATHRGVPIGAAHNLQAFSFGPIKNLTTIHGGAITTGDSAQASRLRTLRTLGVRSDTGQRVRRGEGSYRAGYDIEEVGYRYEMPDVNAAVGLEQLKVLDRENARRAEVAAAYAAELAGVDGIELPRYRDDRSSAHHIYPVLAERRDALASALRVSGVDVGVHYPLNPLVDNLADPIPNARDFAARTITLPMHPFLSDDEVQQVIEAVGAGW
jgi:perosamine synthetase